MTAGPIHYEGFRAGDHYQTLGRTVSEYEILSFVTLTGFIEPLFMDLEYIQRESVFKTRVAPGVLTFALAEGLTLQTGILHGTGLALLSYDVKVLGPVPGRRRHPRRDRGPGQARDPEGGPRRGDVPAPGREPAGRGGDGGNDRPDGEAGRRLISA